MQHKAQIAITLSADDAEELQDFLDGPLAKLLERLTDKATAYDVTVNVDGLAAETQSDVQTNGVHIKGSVTGSMVNIGSGNQTVTRQHSSTDIQAGAGSNVRSKQTHVTVTQHANNVANGVQLGHVSGNIHIGGGKIEIDED